MISASGKHSFAWNETLGKITGTTVEFMDYSEGYLADKAERTGNTAGESLVEGFGTGGSGLSQKARDLNDQAATSSIDEWADIQSEYLHIEEAAASGLDSLPDDTDSIASTAYDEMVGEFDGAKTDYSKVSDNIVKSFDNLPSKLQKCFSKAYTTSLKAWGTAKSDFSKVSANIISSFSNLESGLRIKFTSAFTAAKEAWSGAKSSFNTKSADIISSFSNLASGVKIKFTSAFTAAKEAWSGAKSFFSTTSADVISAFSNLASGVKIKFNSAFTEAKNTWSGAKSAFTTIANNVVSAFSGVTSGVKSQFSTACNSITGLGWYSAGASAAKSVLNGMYSYNPSGWCSWFFGKISFSGANNIGYNLTAGIIRGMYTTSGLGSWANWFVTKVKSSLGIHSPSTVMRDEVGVYLGAGIGVGLEKSTGGILKTVSGLADKIVDGFQDGVSGIVLDAPTLAGGAFSGLSYKYPVLASGTVIPPQTVYSTQKTDTADIVEQLKALVERMGQAGTARNNTTSGNVIHNVVQINRRTLYEEMRSEEELVNSQSGRV